MASKEKRTTVRKRVAQPPQDSTIIAKGLPGFCGDSFASTNEAASILRASIDRPNRLGGFGGANNSFTPLSDRYEQIYKGVMPFNMSSYGGGNIIDMAQQAELCQRAYYNVSIFRNTIDIMTEFSNSEVLFKGGNDKSRKFFENWYYNRIGGISLADQFFLEWYRSGNVFFYRFDADVDLETLRKIGSMYGAENTSGAKKLPIKYLLINPVYLRADQGLNFLESSYYKILTNYEMFRLKNPITDEEKEFAKSLPQEARDAIETGSVALFTLDGDKTHMVFCKRQDYEPFAVPMFFPVLEDIDLKLIYKRMEKTISRTVELVQLKIAVGDGKDDPNYLAIDALKELYQNETIGRVLIAPGPLEMDFVIPDLNKILGPDKYKQVNDDIAQGLMGLFSSDEKYSGASIKVKIFMERLNSARQAFLSSFLNPEIKRISKELGFKSYPTATMAGLDLNDEAQTNKIYLQLLQLGAITADEAIQAIKTGYLPTPEEGLASQVAFRDHKLDLLYAPLMGGGAFGQEEGGENGRPVGTKAPQKTKKPQPAGTSKASVGDYGFELEKLSEIFKLSNDLGIALEKEAKKHFKVKKLNDSQKNILKSLMPLIIANELPEEWISKCSSYISDPIFIKDEVGFKLDEISATFDCSLLLSSILYHCKK